MFPSRDAIEDDETRPDEGGEDDSALREALRGADVATLERMQGMAEDFAVWLHRKGAEQMAEGGDKAVAQVRALSHSFNRAARAVRQIMVLKQETAGLRPTPQARAVASGAAANQNRPGASPSGADRALGAGRGRGDLNDYADRERRQKEQNRLSEYLYAIATALEADVAAAGPDVPDEVRRASLATRLERFIDTIPHPRLDATLARHQLEWLKDLARRKPGQGPPGL